MTRLPMLTIAEVCEQIHASRDHVQDLINGGELKATNIATGHGRRWRIHQHVLDNWLESRST